MNFPQLSRFFTRRDTLVHLLLWMLYFSMVNVSWTADWFDRSLRPNTPAPLSALVFPLYFYLNAYWLLPKYLKGSRSYRYFLVSFLVIAGPEVVRVLLTILPHGGAGTFSESFAREIFSRDSFIFTVPSPILFAFLLSTAYRFTVDWVKNSRKIQKLESEKVAMELNLLKSQINPHFLFNSLNTLDELIEKDQKLAKNYLHILANLYRYVIKNSDQDLVSLQEEWIFIDDYLYLLTERFGAAYVFEKKNEIDSLNRYLVPPTSLQGLLENAIKHNAGSADNPLVIAIEATGNGISVSHLKRPKHTATNNLGTGLKNLNARYKLLINKEIIVTDDEKFTVILPLIPALS